MSIKENKSDVDFVAALAEVLRSNDLSEIEVQREYGKDDAITVRVARAAAAPIVQHVAAAAPAAPSPQPAAAPAAAAAPAPVKSGDPADDPNALRSPMVGTCYLFPEPGAPAFVSTGDKVTEGQTVLIIEAMKTMNQIPAPRAGTVKRILIENGSPVEFGAPLLIIE